MRILSFKTIVLPPLCRFHGFLGCFSDSSKIVLFVLFLADFKGGKIVKFFHKHQQNMSSNAVLLHLVKRLQKFMTDLYQILFTLKRFRLS